MGKMREIRKGFLNKSNNTFKVKRLEVWKRTEFQSSRFTGKYD